MNDFASFLLKCTKYTKAPLDRRNTIGSFAQAVHGNQFNSIIGIRRSIRDNVNNLTGESHSAKLQNKAGLIALHKTHGNLYVQRLMAGIERECRICQPSDISVQAKDLMEDELIEVPENQIKLQVFESGLRSPSVQGGIVEPAARMRSRIRQRARDSRRFDMGHSINRGTEIYYTINESFLINVPNHFLSYNAGRYAGRSHCSIIGAEPHNLHNVSIQGRFAVNNIPWAVRCRVLLPRWSNFSQANEFDKQEWARFMRCLRIHEQGHVDIAHHFISTLAQSERQLSGNNRNQLQQQLSELGQGLQSDLQNMHDDYDDESNHGEAQGAVLRPQFNRPAEVVSAELGLPSMRL